MSDDDQYNAMGSVTNIHPISEIYKTRLSRVKWSKWNHLLGEKSI